MIIDNYRIFRGTGSFVLTKTHVLKILNFAMINSPLVCLGIAFAKLNFIKLIF